VEEVVRSLDVSPGDRHRLARGAPGTGESIPDLVLDRDPVTAVGGHDLHPSDRVVRNEVRLPDRRRGADGLLGCGDRIVTRDHRRHSSAARSSTMARTPTIESRRTSGKRVRGGTSSTLMSFTRARGDEGRAGTMRG
jgi:hypothetical protein